jgi:very-short-patch-repair endonuclease
MSDFAKFLEIRETYAALLPEWMEIYEATGDMRHNPYFMDWQFTPIERNVWSDIRQLGLPFYPQLPALNYFLDFGNPFLKIGIGCDGKAWHDKELDRARDARLAAAGWMIFRLEGHKCMRVVDTVQFGGLDEDEAHVDDLGLYFGTTSEGILQAIKQKYFSDAPATVAQYYIDATLFEHCSTPDTLPARRPRACSGGPKLISESLGDYLELIGRRVARTAA